MAFYSCSYFPAKTEIGVFPPSWHCPKLDLLGRVEEMAASQCFLMAGCGWLLCLAQAQQLLRQSLATRTPLCPHAYTSHHRIKVQDGQMTGVQGSVWDWGKLGALCQWGSHDLLRIKRAVQSSTVNYTDWAGRYLTTTLYTQTHKTTLPLPLSLNILLYTANCALWHCLTAENLQRQNVCVYNIFSLWHDH